MWMGWARERTRTTTLAGSNELLSHECKNIIPAARPIASDYEIYYGIITKQKKSKLNVPFFSKVVLKNNKKILEAYGYKIFLTKIKYIKVDEN